jgi:hypothetical protein
MSDFVKGQKVKFKGYSADTPKSEQVLSKGSTYEITDVETDDDGVTLVVRADNPSFDPDQPESKKNAKTVLVDVFAEEVDAVSEKKTDKTATKGKGKTEAKAEAKPARSRMRSEPKGEEEEEEEIERLEKEDKDVLKLLKNADDILELAQELAEDSAVVDYKLGGVLYHIRLDKAYEKLDKKYKENGGFGLYVKEHLNTEYRKAMYLIDIYFKANKYGIDPAKIAAMGWTKAAKIAAVMTEDNAEELVKLAEESSVSDLIDTIKESYKEVGGKRGVKKKMITFKFRLFEDQADATSRVLKSAAEQLGLKRLDDAFEHIVMEWGVEHGLIKKKDVPQRPVEEEKSETKANGKAKPAKAAKTAKAPKVTAPPPAKAGKRVQPRRSARQ